eukprot:m51a1_g13299 hypothetical protein (459) ;mRNA; f:648-2101
MAQEPRRAAPAGANVDLTEWLPDDIVAHILAIASRGAQASDVCSFTRVCHRWRRHCNAFPFVAWRDAEFRWRLPSRAPSALVGVLTVSHHVDRVSAGLWRPRPPGIDPSLWGPHTLVLDFSVDEKVALELVKACRDSLRVLKGAPENAAAQALATCPLLAILDISTLGFGVWSGFAERARAGLPAISELPGENELCEGVLPPRGSPEGAMIAEALRRVRIECVPDETLQSFVELGCQRLEEMTVVVRIGEDELEGEDLSREARRLAESVGPLQVLEVEQMTVPLLEGFASVDRLTTSLRRLEWVSFFMRVRSIEQAELDNIIMSEALVRLTALTELVIQDPDLNDGALVVIDTLPSLSSLTIGWDEGAEDSVAGCTALTSLTLCAWKHSSESLRMAVAPLPCLVHLTVMDVERRGASVGVRWINGFLAEMAEHAEWLPTLRTLAIQDELREARRHRGG